MSRLGRLLDRVRGVQWAVVDRAWAGSVEDLLFDGESVRRRVVLDFDSFVTTDVVRRAGGGVGCRGAVSQTF